MCRTRWLKEQGGWRCEGPVEAQAGGVEAIYLAMLLGLRDYVGKNGFPGVVIGMSGGIDSALTAAVAVDALGAERVRLVMMPSPYTSQHSLEDAAEAAGLLGARIDEVGIAPGDGRVRADAGRDLRRSPRRHYRGEHPGAEPRRWC